MQNQSCLGHYQRPDFKQPRDTCTKLSKLFKKTPDVNKNDLLSVQFFFSAYAAYMLNFWGLVGRKKLWFYGIMMLMGMSHGFRFIRCEVTSILHLVENNSCQTCKRAPSSTGRKQTVPQSVPLLLSFHYSSMLTCHCISVVDVQRLSPHMYYKIKGYDSCSI